MGRVLKDRGNESKDLIHPFFSSILLHSSLLIRSDEHRFTNEFCQFVMGYLCCMRSEVLTDSDINMDIFDHYMFKFHLQIVEINRPLLFPPTAVETGEFCFLYVFFKNLMEQSPEMVPIYLEELSKKLFELIKYVGIEPEKAGRALLFTLLVLNYFIKKNPTRDVSIIKQFLSRIQFFLNMPDPVGTDCSQ